VGEDSERKPRVNDPDAPVVHAILAQGAIRPTHEYLAEIGGFSERTVANVVGDLAADQLLVRGHPARLGPGMGLVVGISMGSESVRVGVVDANGTLHVEDELPALPGQLRSSPEGLLGRVRQAAVDTLRRAFDEPKLRMDDGTLALHGVAIAWPAPMNRDKVPGAAGLRDGGWRRVDTKLRRRLTLPERTAAALGAPFTADTCHALNDVNAQALAIAFDKARARAREPAGDDQWRVAMVVRVGGGLGSAIITLAPHDPKRLSFIDSRLIAGTNGYAGELGHLPVEPSVIAELNADCPFSEEEIAALDYETAKCSCGRMHHLEAFASGSALARRFKDSGHTGDDPGTSDTELLRSILDGDLDAVQAHAVGDVGRLIGRALASPILMLDPYSITFTGSLAIEELEHGVQLERKVWTNAVGDSVKIETLTSEQGAFAGVRGAALAVLRRHVYRKLDQVVDRQITPPLRLTRADLAAMRRRS
jgi:predicted NBD/HSP70 family sugar kinase